MRWWQIKKRDADLERELQSDLDLEEEEQRDRGVTYHEARFAAQRAFGNATLIREQTREGAMNSSSMASLPFIECFLDGRAAATIQ